MWSLGSLALGASSAAACGALAARWTIGGRSNGGIMGISLFSGNMQGLRGLRGNTKTHCDISTLGIQWKPMETIGNHQNEEHRGQIDKVN